MLQNRDFSWLGFNLRVLQEAADKTVPLFERMKFLSIFSSNLDEFFRVRYPAVVALNSLKEKTKIKASIETNEDMAEKIQLEVNRQLEFFGATLTGQIIPELKKSGIIFYYNSPIENAHLQEMREIFLSHVLAFIQPVFIETNNQAFLPQNNRLYFLVTLKEENQEILKQAIVNIPSGSLKRFFTLSPLSNTGYVVFLDDIIRENLHFIFPRMKIVSVYSFKLNRNAEMNLSDEYSGDLLNKIERQLKKRDIGASSRFLYEASMPANLQLFLADAFAVKYDDMFAGGRYHNLSDLSSFPVTDEKLQFKKFTPLTSAKMMNSGDIFNLIEKQDVLLHLPYQSYNPVLSFFNQAAVDADVTDIYITLYRLAADSHIVNALMSAAKNGKNVVVFIELKARFDEANNIKWSRMMKEAGVTLQYSLPQIKVHSKIALVKKTSAGRELSYAVLSTGNFNEVTARFYTDHVLMTADKKILKELQILFTFLAKGTNEIGEAKARFNELLVSQFNLVSSFEKLINREIEKVKKGQPARVRIKVNNLEEPGMINLLTKAAVAGVQVDLMVRSVCCIDGASENLTVRRIVDRFLEHTRLYIFGADDDAKLIVGSSDLMTRNLYHRIEVCFPVKDSNCRRELLDYFDIQWADNTKAVQLNKNNEFQKVISTDQDPVNAQETIYQYLKDRA